MGSLSRVAVTAILAFGAAVSRVAAFDDIQIERNVRAGQDAKVQITNDLSKGSSSFDAGFTNYNVYLVVEPPGWGQNPVCLLVNGSDIKTTDFSVQIPASVGPDASNYSIATKEINTDPDKDGPSGFEYSNSFTLTGATGAFSAYETQPKEPLSLGDEDLIPCTAYDCARQCNQKNYPADTDENDEAAYKTVYECVAACPGVTYPPYDSEADDGGEGDGASSGTAAPTGSATGSSASKSTNAPAAGTASGSARPASTSTGAASAAAGTSTPSPSQGVGAAGGAPLSTVALAIAMIAGIITF